MSRPGILRILRNTTTIAALQATVPAAASAQEAVDLGTIWLGQYGAGSTTLATGDANDIGTTVLSGDGVDARSDGSGDANTSLTTLPNVQYRDNASLDAGENNDDVLDLQPLELSISGGKVSENAIALDGIGINSIAPTGPSSGDLSREDNQPNLFSIYGLHSQTQFVPSALVDSVEVIDSNISAEYGGFQGGVVNYTLKKPSVERGSGTLKYSFQSSDMVSYHLGTEDGENPDDRPKPDFSKQEFAAEINQPLGERTALRFGFGTRRAEAEKRMDPQYRQRDVGNTSRSDFYSLALLHELETGGALSFGLKLTDYRQQWSSNWVENFNLDVESRSVSLDAGYDKQWDLLSVGGLDIGNAALSLRAIHQDNRSSNRNDEAIYYGWYGTYTRNADFTTDAFDDWCDTSIETDRTGISCRTGGYGDTDYTDTRSRLEARFSGDIWRGAFLAGLAVEQTRARRSGSGFTYNSVTERLDPDAAFDAFICEPGDATCLPDQYFDGRISQDPYDVTVDATKAEAFFQLDQTWGDFGLRAGLRADWNDVLDNIDVAPRLSARWTPNPDLSLTLGANRYYSGSYMTYAIHDAVPRGANQSRSHDDATGEVGAWGMPRDLGQYSYRQGDLRTPYVDEASFGVQYRDRVTGGNWRLRYIDRQGKDQFARSQDSTSLASTLSNDGSNAYRALTLEYRKQWQTTAFGPLDAVGLYVSGTVAERETSNDSYFGDDGTPGEDDYIWYDGKSYTRNDFRKVSGNLDIPVRSTVELTSSWQGGRYALALGADVTFGYEGVRNSSETGRFESADGATRTHDIYEDYSFDTEVSAYLRARMRLARMRGSDLNLDVTVANLFDNTGNQTASDSNPWLRGRSVYVGTSLEW